MITKYWNALVDIIDSSVSWIADNAMRLVKEHLLDTLITVLVILFVLSILN